MLYSLAIGTSYAIPASGFEDSPLTHLRYFRFGDCSMTPSRTAHTSTEMRKKSVRESRILVFRKLEIALPFVRKES